MKNTTSIIGVRPGLRFGRAVRPRSIMDLCHFNARAWVWQRRYENPGGEVFKILPQGVEHCFKPGQCRRRGDRHRHPGRGGQKGFPNATCQKCRGGFASGLLQRLKRRNHAQKAQQRRDRGNRFQRAQPARGLPQKKFGDAGGFFARGLIRWILPGCHCGGGEAAAVALASRHDAKGISGLPRFPTGHRARRGAARPRPDQNIAPEFSQDQRYRCYRQSRNGPDRRAIIDEECHGAIVCRSHQTRRGGGGGSDVALTKGAGAG